MFASSLWILLASVLFLAVSCFAHDVTAIRIDGRPPGHPLDSGGEDPDPIIDASVPNAGGNTNFPSMIRVPDWVPTHERPHPSANYYLYFSSHTGHHIRLAWAESLRGEWTIWNPKNGKGIDRAWGIDGGNTGVQTPGRGVLDMDLGGDPIFALPGGVQLEGHLASPEAVVDEVNQRIVLFVHAFHRTPGWRFAGAQGRGHDTFVATSEYGLNFNMPDEGGEAGHGLRETVISRPYSRVVQIDGESDGQQVWQTMTFSLGGAINLAPLRTASGGLATFANADEPGGFFNPAKAGHDGKTFYWREFEGTKPMFGAERAREVVPPPEQRPGWASGEVRQGARHIDVYYNADADRNTVYAFYHAAGDMPESILMTRMSLEGLDEEERLDPANWRRIDQTEQVLLVPQLAWEGGELELKPTPRGAQSKGRALRDPDLFLDDDGRLYMIYVGMSETNIGIAEIRGIHTDHQGP